VGLVAAMLSASAGATVPAAAPGSARAASMQAPAGGAAGTPAPASPGHAPPPLGATVALSNERTRTVWAHPLRVTAILARPRAESRRRARIARHGVNGRVDRIGELHLYTEDGFPEVYMLLAERVLQSGKVWVRIRIPARPNGQIGWVPRGALGSFHSTRWQLVVNRAAERMTAYWDGRQRWSAPVGMGAPGTPTPAGRFWIREKFPIGDRASGYWPDAFGTADYSTLSEWPGGGVVGIHGPYGEPGAIPGHPSHGCIRMHTGDVAWLYRHIPVGAALRVL
jgi:hypothetical protein